MPIDTLLDQFAAEDQKALSRSGLIAHNVNPDKHAANLKDAKKRGIPPAFATEATEPPNEDKLQSLLNDLNKLPDHSPKTAAFLSDPEKMKLSHDDHPILSKFEGLVRPFKGAAARIAQGVNEANAAFLDTLATGTEAVEKVTGMSAGGGFREGSNAAKQGAEYWRKVAEKNQVGGVAGEVYKGIGSAPMGIAEFTANVPYAAAKGAAEGYRKGGVPGLVEGAITEAAKRFGIGKIFKGIEESALSPVKKSLAMAGTMGAQTAAEGGGIKDVVASTLTGLVLMPPKAGSHGESIRSELVKKGLDAEIAREIGGHVDGVIAHENAGILQDLLDTAKESKLKERDGELFKSFAKSATEESKPVAMPVEKFDALLTEKGLKPEDVLDDPTEYYEAKFEGRPVDIPLSDLAGIAEHITPEHVKAMSVEGAPSVAEVEKSKIKQPWEMTREEYESSEPKGDGEWDAFDVKGVLVLKNPISSDIKDLSKQFRDRYPNAPSDSVKIRSTIDSDGNKYIWPADEATHGDIEPFINKKYNVTTNQNGVDRPTHSRVIRIALQKGKEVPYEVLKQYPYILDSLREATAARAEKSARDIQPKGEEAATLRPAVRVGDDIKTGADGERHTDIVKDTPEETRGFTLDGETMLSREEGSQWLKSERPDLWEKLPADQKESLHSEGLWSAQGVETPKERTTDFQMIRDNLSQQTGIVKGKTNKGNFTESDFQNYLKENYPSVAGTEKSRVMSALDAQIKGRKLTDGQQQIIDLFNHDEEVLRQKYGDIDAQDRPLYDEILDDIGAVNIDARDEVFSFFDDIIREAHDEIRNERETVSPTTGAENQGSTASEGRTLYEKTLAGDQGKLFATPPTFGKKPQPGQGLGTGELLDNFTPDPQQEILLHAGINPLDGVRAVMNLTGEIRTTAAGKKVEKLMTPGLEAASGIARGVKSLLLPTANSPLHLEAAETLGAKLGKMHRNQESAASDMRADWRTFEKLGAHNDKIPLTENAGVKFMSNMSQGRVMEPKLERIAEKIRGLFADRLSQLEQADVPMETVRENYFPGMWTNESRKAFNLAIGGMIERGIGEGKPLAEWSTEAKAMVRERVKALMEGEKGSEKDGLRYLTRTPFKGKESFRKQKVFDDIMTAVEFGLEPVSTNPVELVQLKLAEMDRSIMANSALQEWRAQGKEKFLSVNKPVPEGWEKVNDKYGTVWGPSDMAGEDVYIGRPILGYRIVTPEVGDILNNYLSSSLYNNRYVGTLYKGYMGLANALNQSQLGVGSFFHVGFTESEVTISGGAELLKDLYGAATGSRSIAQVAKTAAKVPASFIKTPMEGNAVLKSWRNPDAPMDPRIKQVAKAAEIAGGGFRLESGLRTDQTSKMIQDWYGEKKVRAALRSPVAAVELMAKPIMDFLVPRQKAGVFAHLAWRIIEQNPNVPLESLVPQFRQAWNRVDARLGQVRYDRLFMNNAAKNAVQGLVRAPGWSGGTIAEVGGAFKDAAAFVKEWAETGKAPKELPDRIAYTLSLMGIVSAVNGLLTYAFTGDKPEGIDWWAFRTGGTDEYGKPERFVLPTYQKDIFAYYEDPGKTFLAKSHPVISLIGDMIKNRDYYGVTIAPEDEAAFGKAMDYGLYGVKQFVPFWIRGAQKEVERGGGLMETLTTQPQKILAPQIGVMPATSAYTKSPAEKTLSTFIGQQIPSGGRTQEAADQTKERREIVRAIRNGATFDTLPEKLQERAQGLTDKQIKGIEKEAAMSPLQASFQHLQDPTLEKSMKVWKKATDAEREELRDLYETRVNKYFLTHELTDEEQQKLNERLQKAEERQ